MFFESKITFFINIKYISIVEYMNMGPLVNGEDNILMCTFGTGPSMLIALPVSMVMIDGMPLATIMDVVPIMNIPPFPTCVSPANPKPPIVPVKVCIPTVVGTWIPGVPTFIAGVAPALDMDSKAICEFGGVISVMMPGQFQMMAAV